MQCLLYSHWLTLPHICLYLQLPTIQATMETSAQEFDLYAPESMRHGFTSFWDSCCTDDILQLSVCSPARGALSLSLSNILVGGIHQTWLVSTSRQISSDVNVNIKENTRCGLIDNCRNNQMSNIFKQTTIFVINLLYVGYLKICNKF